MSYIKGKQLNHQRFCNWQDNANRIGGMNVSLRSLLSRQAEEERAMCQLAYSNHDGNSSSELRT